MIRRARSGDAEALAELNARAWMWAYAGYVEAERILAAGAELRQRWHERLAEDDDPPAVWLWEDADGVAGFATVGPARDDDAGPDVGELRAIYVEPERVGRGVGHALLLHAEAELARMGCRTATLWVFDANQRARAFYERHGWTLEPGTGPGPWDWAPCVRYRKQLAAR